MNKCLLLGLLFPVLGANAATICKVDDSSHSIDVQVIAWNEVDGTAKVSDKLGSTHRGKVTAIRQHNEGYKVNIFIEYSEPYFGNDFAEYIIFPVAQKAHRVIGVSYVNSNGKKLLNTLQGNFAATCASL